MRYLYQTILISSFIFLLSVAASAQPFSALRKYDINNGLSENTVRTIVQDKTGYIWFGTKDGICKYNGQGFKNYGGYPKITDINLLDVLKLCVHHDGKRLWIGAIDGLYLFDPDTETFEQFVSKPKVRSNVNDLCYDDKGNLWIATAYGLLCYNETENTTREYLNDGEKGCLPSNVTLSLLKDSSGAIWVGTREGLACYHSGLDKFTIHKLERGINGNTPCEITHIIEGCEGDLWIGTRYDGILNFDRLSGEFKAHKVSSSRGNGNTWIRALHELQDGNLFIGTEDGLFTFNPDTNSIKSIKDFSKSVIYAFSQDHEGGVWIGTYFDGIYYLPPQNANVNWMCEVGGENSLSGKAVSQFCEDSSGNLWIATEDEGLNFFNTRTRRFTHYKTSSAPPCRISHNNLHSLMIKDNQLWIGTFSKGIDIFDTENRRIIKNYRSDPSNETTLPNNHIYCIYKTSKDVIYVGTMKGFSQYVPETDSFHTFKMMKNIFVYDMIEDKYGTLWIATKNDGIWKMTDGTFKQYRHNQQNTTSPGSNHIIRTYIDSKENLWFATEGSGICRYDYENDSFINYNYKKGLYHHIVYGILDDSEGNLWLSTTYGIVKYNPDTMESLVYTQEDGMQSNQFNYRSSIKTSNGRFYFGGINGFNVFDPKSFKTNEIEPITTIPNIILHKKDSQVESIKPAGKVSISHNVVSFDISFECLSYISPSKNKYAYKIEELHKDWLETDRPSVSFANLPAGRYRLWVKSANNDGIWSSEPTFVDIEVTNPLWKTTVAKLFYLLVLALLSAAVISWWIKENRNRQEREKKQLEMQMQQESYRSKFQFFTHVAHEIKTPLTLIKAPLDVIIEGGKCDSDTMENLLVMKQNTDRLMELIKQLLNFRKIDTDGYTLTYSNVDINGFVNTLIKRFETTGNNINIRSRLPMTPVEACIDPEAVTKILSNLLSNSLKYASSQIILQVETLDWDGNTNIVFSVHDDGPGISEHEIERIFEPFYRSAESNKENSFGIGLSLVKLLVEKLRGTVKAGKSSDLGGLVITVMIPQAKETERIKGRDSTLDKKNTDNINTVKVEQHQVNLLIVEDTKEMLDFLMKNLGHKFNVYGAENGKEAIRLLEKTPIDIILSDVVMPEMDGFELLYNIRSDKMLCHIPFILLSAQGNVNSKIAGLDYGADAYMEKPFSITHVIATIESLLKNRKLLFDRFTSMPNLDYGSDGMKAGDAQWLDSLTDIIKQNLTNEQFTVDMLASEMAVSRSNLRRKVIGVTGLPPNDYIRLIRLKVAAELLKEGKHRINEVCYLVGFSSHSYFSTCFQKQFGMLPKDFAKK